MSARTGGVAVAGHNVHWERRHFGQARSGGAAKRYRSEATGSKGLDEPETSLHPDLLGAHLLHATAPTELCLPVISTSTSWTNPTAPYPVGQCRRFDLAMIVLTEQRNVPLRRSTPSACGTRPELLLWKPCRDRTVRRPRCLSAAFFSVPWANDGRSRDCPTTRTGERRSRQLGKSHPPNS
jgi:hypothetical protein